MRWMDGGRQGQICSAGGVVVLYNMMQCSQLEFVGVARCALPVDCCEVQCSPDYQRGPLPGTPQG